MESVLKVMINSAFLATVTHFSQDPTVKLNCLYLVSQVLVKIMDSVVKVMINSATIANAINFLLGRIVKHNCLYPVSQILA